MKIEISNVDGDLGASLGVNKEVFMAKLERMSEDLVIPAIKPVGEQSFAVELSKIDLAKYVQQYFDDAEIMLFALMNLEDQVAQLAKHYLAGTLGKSAGEFLAIKLKV